jgi:hypothetical protein
MNLSRSPVAARAIALIITCSGAVSTEQGVIPARTYSEHLELRVKVSGDLIVGVMGGDPDARVDLSNVSVVLPKTSLPLLCMHVTSQDGAFTAQSEYGLQGVFPGIVRLQFPTRYSVQLSSLRARQLAVRAWLASTCAKDPEVLVVATWNQGQPLGPLTFLINSRDYRTSLRFSHPSSLGETVCEQITNETVTAYNLTCTISDTYGQISLQAVLRRIRGPHHLQPVTVNVTLQ